MEKYCVNCISYEAFTVENIHGPCKVPLGFCDKKMEAVKPKEVCEEWQGNAIRKKVKRYLRKRWRSV